MKSSAIPFRKAIYQGLAKRFASLTQAAYDGVLIYDAGVILNATTGAAALFGRVPRELDRCSIADLFTRESRLALQRLGDAPGVPCPALALRGDGNQLPIELSVKASVILRGRRVYVIALRDASRDEAKPHLTDQHFRRKPFASAGQN